MKLDSTTSRLFSVFPREVGNPTRWLIYDEKAFQDFLIQNNGYNECFTSVFPNSKIIDKIFFDLDGEGALADAKILYKYIISKGWNAIPVASGKKGYHIYLLLKPKKYGDSVKELFLRASYNVVKQAFGKPIEQTTVDPRVLGDIQRLCRIPNTLRVPELRSFCTYLPYNFTDWTECQCVEHMKTMHTYNYRYTENRPTLLDLIGNEELEDIKIRMPVVVRSPSFQIPSTNEGVKILKPLVVKECLFRAITSIHPTHEARLAVTVDLLNCGVSEEDVICIYEKLGWEDYNRQITRYQVYQIGKHQEYKSYCCKKLHSLGMVIDNECKECFLNK